jgi:sucrose-6-phosphate hydrolase SacC (GH32 family)
MPFNQMIGLPVELTLHPSESGLRLHANPVAELKSLRQSRTKLKAQTLEPGFNPLQDWQGELVEVIAEFSPSPASQLVLELRGVPITYDHRLQELACGDKKVNLMPLNGTIRLHVFVDRTSVDIFANNGAVYMPMGVLVPQENQSAKVCARNGTVRLSLLEVYRLKSAWR